MKSRSDQPPTTLDDPRVIAALDEYLAALEQGQRLDRTTFLRQHEEVADALALCLEGIEALHSASSSAHHRDGDTDVPNFVGGCEPGTSLGDFHIIREIGRGGMGVVYEAEQLSLERRIALKVLSSSLTLDPRQLQRFKNESRAAAHLHHPHIVPVYSVGCERSIHFYAMQYVEGESLAEVIARLRDIHEPETVAGRRAVLVDAPREKHVDSLTKAYCTNRLTFFREVARLGVQAAEAIEHAHEYGVVHRDIKPGNLLVDASGHLWVTDFGLAQFRSDSGLTQTGDLLGTLRYMSPEQATGKGVLLDHRTDLYSLGATLYELLTLEPLFGSVDRLKLLHQILREEPRPPRALLSSIPVDLETILLKAMAKVPAERYGTAKEMADDLSRFLNDQPILARRVTLPQRARKWARRHPTVFIVAALLCLMTTFGSLVSIAMIRGEQEMKQAAYQRERQRSKEAEERFVLARELVNRLVKVCEEELSSDPRHEGLRRLLLAETLEYYQKLIEQRRDDPDAQAELAATQIHIQKILTDLAELHGASQLYLLEEPEIQDELGVSEEQRHQIRELPRLSREQFPKFRGFQGMSEEERRQQFLGLAREYEAVVTVILSKQQLIRFRQIALQAKGLRAFSEPEVVKTLTLTTEQKERIRLMEMDNYRPAPDKKGKPPEGRPGLGSPGGRGPGGPGGPRKDHEPNGWSAVEKALEVLTAEQMQRWKEMTGKSYRGSLRQPPPRGPKPPL